MPYCKKARKHFEKWASDITVQLDITHHKDVPNTYQDSHTGWAFCGWLAALEFLAKEKE